MKQRKVKKELVLTTYWDYLKHFGRENGRKKWREHKEGENKKRVVNVDRVFEAGEKYVREILAEDEKYKKKMNEMEAKIKAERENSNYYDASKHLFEVPQVDDLEPIQKAVLGGAERQDIRKTKADIFECGASMIELIGMSAWNKWIKPQIQKDAVDFVRKTLMLSGEESHKATGGYNYARKILKTIDKWVQDYTYLMREEEKKQNAISQTRK